MGRQSLSDPFDKTLAFLAQFDGVRAGRAWDEGPIQPIESLDTGPAEKLDLDELERLARFHGVVPRPREMRDDEYPDDLIEHISEREPPFVLRNLPRVEREHWEEGDMELDRHRTLVGFRAEGAIREPFVHEPPRLLGEMTLDVFLAERSWARWLKDEARWERHFSRELKGTVDGPMWRYDPDAAEAEAKAAAEAEAEGDSEEPEASP